MARIYHDKEQSLCNNTKSPLRHVEDKFVAIIFALSNIGSPWTVCKTMALIQSLIEGTPVQQHLIKFQKQFKKNDKSSDLSSNCLGKISTKYYYSFMNRHKAAPESNKAHHFEAIWSGDCYSEIFSTCTLIFRGWRLMPMLHTNYMHLFE